MGIEIDSLTNKEKMLKMAEKALEFCLRNFFSILPAASIEADFSARVAIDTVNRNIDIIFRSAESEIEKIFLNSLVLRTVFETAPFFLIFTEPLSSPIEQIENAREIYHITAEILSFLEENMLIDADKFEKYRQYILSTEKNEQKQLEALNYVAVYFALKFHNRFHVSIQSTFPDIQVNGKCIRPDIFIWLPSNPEFKLIVECDGYAYHSDKESFTNDRVRDRILQAKGFQVHRFSGQEIVNNPLFKSGDLYDYLYDVYQKQSI